MKRLILLAAVALAGTCTGTAGARVTAAPHNVVLFIPDGLRAQIVDARTAPAMAAVRDRGVAFRNSHSLFPTFTTPNASAMATGHYRETRATTAIRSTRAIRWPRPRAA